MKSILVTGGTGFIGSHTCLKLLEQGYYLFIMDSFVNSSPIVRERLDTIFSERELKIEDRLSLIEGDIRDYSLLSKIFEYSSLSQKPIQAVLHFAGLKSITESVSKPLHYWDVNVNGSISLLRAMEQNKCRTIVFSSSATIYGSNGASPLSEDLDLKPLNPYGRTKEAVERILHDVFISSRSKWRIANLRYFNPIGSHPSGNLGEDPMKIPTNLFPYICQVAVGRHNQLRIFGKDWPTPDGTAIRDYIHVMDVADAHYVALEFLFENQPQIFNLNIGTGRGTSVLELVQTFERVNGCKVPYVFADRRHGEEPITFARNELAYSKLNWLPKRNLEDMCRDGWKWQKLNPNGYAAKL